MESIRNTSSTEAVALADGIQREDQVIEIPRRIYRDTDFSPGELTATVDEDAVVVAIATIEGDVTIRLPQNHLVSVARLLAHVRDDLP